MTEIRIDAGPGVPRPLVATADQVSLGGQTFALADLTGLQWRDHRVNEHGAHLSSSFTLQVWAGDRSAHWGMAPSPRDAQVHELAATFGQILALLDGAVGPRLAVEMAGRLRAGESITLGPAGARVELTAAGFRLKKAFAKPVPWGEVTGVEAEGGRVFLVLDGGRRHSKVPLEGENLVVLPRLVALIRPAAGWGRGA